MIYISQGHEKGIGLEVFLKSFIAVPKDQRKKIILYCYKSSLADTLDSFKIKYTINDDVVKYYNVELSCVWLCKTGLPQSTVSLNTILDIIKADDILVTLPTSKDQLLFEGQSTQGHTDFFRKKYSRYINMVFISPNYNLLLLTDHLPIKKLSKSLLKQDNSLIITNALNSLNKIRTTHHIYFSSLNPHNGEDGLIGSEDSEIINQICSTHKHLRISSGDSLFNLPINYKETLLVSSFHDQGLSAFKSLNKLIGINFSTNLDFTRFSPDHGTAFDLYGKNIANYTGMSYVLESTLRVSCGDKI